MIKRIGETITLKKSIFIFIGCLLAASGLLLLRHAGLVTGGIAGLSLNLTHITPLPLALLFFLINIPFYIFSFVKMGVSFTVVTMLSVSVLSGIIAIDLWLPAFSVPLLTGAIVGGALIGCGLSLLFSQQASLGGANIVALFFQKRYGIDPGKTNFLFDLAVALLSLFTIGLIPVLGSILSIVITSKVISYFRSYFIKKEVTTDNHPHPLRVRESHS
ncbi:Uncharacterized membrane-anchored protein YitT, contains DUF161 and DUF2179 domains [Shouchella lonarensis]|uniref:Uncharacterized membrane-anchored protein YitT, contains DUF161 and DUF2179 domains n=1 Tax=Shouchella lonarensis TaxID=1464122 RepID=A0A1G6GNY9_9BACI|nr:Uncharacterized membrane-anchored protein YitT, contains DUF161 and DUF2179 domains [Shouchella lonarensis]